MSPKRIQIVSSDNKLIGHKSRNEIDYDKDIYRSTALWITNSDGQVLIAQRKLTKSQDGGKWGPAVAGTVDEGETYQSNVYKEAEEEIGLLGVKFTKDKLVFYGKPRMQWMQWYRAVVGRPVSSFTIQEDEVEQLAWIDYAELASDVKNNPDKYVSMMPGIIKQFGD